MDNVAEDILEISKTLEELTPLYKSLVLDYKDLQDNDPTTAFDLMKKASSLLASIDSLVARTSGTAILQEKIAKATHAKKSCAMSIKPTEGERQAAKDEEVLSEWANLSMVVNIQKQLEALARHLNRIYFDTKSIFEIGNKRLSKGFKYE